MSEFTLGTPPMVFRKTEGDWTTDGDVLRLIGVAGGSRCFTRAKSNFRLDVRITIDESGQATIPPSTSGQPVGEAKIIFSDADEGEAYRIDFMVATNWCRITLSNSIATITPCRIIIGEELKVHLEVRNNFLSLFVNGMQLVRDYQFGTTSDGNIGFGTYRANASFREIKISELIHQKCFVIMPFNEKRNFLYEYVIVPTLNEHPVFDFEVIRADRLLTAEKIINEITEGIEKADLLIVDISEENMNVFYELGFGHAFKKKAVLLRESSTQGTPPFDIRDFRYHPYEFSPEGFKTLRGRLSDIITTVLSK